MNAYGCVCMYVHIYLERERARKIHEQHKWTAWVALVRVGSCFIARLFRRAFLGRLALRSFVLFRSTLSVLFIGENSLSFIAIGSAGVVVFFPWLRHGIRGRAIHLDHPLDLPGAG
jgi:hypothetical protein